ncbi:MAG: hypothetical protein AAGF23_17240 [Acidobacteriota bacterium]
MTDTFRTFTRASFRRLSIAAVALLGASAAGAATLDVCASGCTYSSVATAIASAASGDTVELANQTFYEGGITVDKSLTVRGLNMATIDAQGHGWVFKVRSGHLVDFENLTLLGGTFARIDNAGSLDLSNVQILGQGQTSTMGGVLNRAAGSLWIGGNSVIASNGSTFAGGGLSNYGDLVITNTTVIGNHGKNGGGVWNRLGTVTVLASSFSFNTADHYGGAWANLTSGGASGSVAFHGSASTSGNTATINCDTSWDQATGACVN